MMSNEADTDEDADANSESNNIIQVRNMFAYIIWTH